MQYKKWENMVMQWATAGNTYLHETYALIFCRPSFEIRATYQYFILYAKIFIQKREALPGMNGRHRNCQLAKVYNSRSAFFVIDLGSLLGR